MTALDARRIPRLAIKENVLGRGVYSCDYIARGQLIEAAPVIFFPKYAATSLEVVGGPQNLGDYVWHWSTKVAGKRVEALVMGVASFMNHSNQPNVNSEYNTIKRAMSFHAAREIFPDEELLIDYGEGAERFKQ